MVKKNDDVREQDEVRAEQDEAIAESANVSEQQAGGMPAIMSETIPGGATLKSDGVTWQDANGQPLSKEQVAAAKQIAQERQKAAAAMQKEMDENYTKQMKLRGIV